MRSAMVHTVTTMKNVNTKYGPKVVAKIQLPGEPQREYWLTPKQADKLLACMEYTKNGFSGKDAEVHAVLEDGEGDFPPRMIWFGLHTRGKSDLKFLEDKFGVEIESPYIGRQDKIDAAPPTLEPDPSLVDAD